MKFVGFDDGKSGLVVELPTGPHVLDIVASLSVLAPGDPISLGILNGLFKDNNSWAPLVQHWQMARIGLIRLARAAGIEGSGVVLRSLDGACLDAQAPPTDGIISVEITEVELVSRDPTGREVMARQFSKQEPKTHEIATQIIPLDAYRAPPQSK
jgi:hypothetical protein